MPTGAEMARQEGLLHDARNLMGTIGIYCDLLSMPGVLQAKHRCYAEELRLLGARCGTLLGRMMERRMHSPRARKELAEGAGTGDAWETRVSRSLALAKLRAAGGEQTERAGGQPGPVSLRTIVERCSGLLSQVADGRTIEVSYGEAASAASPASEEAAQRILLNLVSNSAAAMRGAEGMRGGNGEARGKVARAAVVERIADRTSDETLGAIRIGVGVLINRAQDPRSWPLRRLRLTVEDCGCGMTAEQLERLLNGTRAPSRGRHGIGFHVVRELVAASRGDLRVMSAPGIGTRVQIEWPVMAWTQVDAEPVTGQRGDRAACDERGTRC
jgi:signal transduction histidine kinase